MMQHNATAQKCDIGVTSPDRPSRSGPPRPRRADPAPAATNYDSYEQARALAQVAGALAGQGSTGMPLKRLRIPPAPQRFRST
jgi:hypothetical protein